MKRQEMKRNCLPEDCSPRLAPVVHIKEKIVLSNDRGNIATS